MKPRVVALAFTCMPNAGSEYEVGWRWSQAAGEAGEVLTLTRRNCFNALPAVVEHHPLFGCVKRIAQCTYKAVDLPGAEHFFIGRRFMRLHYIIWQILALWWVRRYRCHFDFAHHICFVSAWLPPLVAISGLPYIWGPVGSSAALPAWARKGARGYFWNLVTQTITRHNPLVRSVAMRSSLLLPINRHTGELISASLARRTIIRPAVGQDILPSDQPLAKYKPLVQATVICSTRNVPIKMPELCFQACITLAQRNPELTVKIIGDQINEVFRTDLSNLQVIDALCQADFFRELEKAQVLLFPTLEGSGFVALEALARGLPAVCLEGSGPADFIAGTAGISVPIANDLMITANNLAEACELLLCDRVMWQRSSDSAFERAPTYRWSELNNFLKEEYAKIAGKPS
jgi:glycosyltransferase involved in cell wall biosynthesis